MPGMNIPTLLYVQKVLYVKRKECSTCLNSQECTASIYFSKKKANSLVEEEMYRLLLFSSGHIQIFFEYG